MYKLTDLSGNYITFCLQHQRLIDHNSYMVKFYILFTTTDMLKVYTI